jgi:hypothetical protein
MDKKIKKERDKKKKHMSPLDASSFSFILSL